MIVSAASAAIAVWLLAGQPAVYDGAGAANPYAIGAGVALKVLSANARRRRQQKEMEYQEKINRKERQQRAIANLIDVGRGLKEL